MEIEAIRQFLADHAPFSQLEPDQLARAVRAIEIRYYRRGTLIVEAGITNIWLSIVRSGAVELRLGGSELNARISEGGCFGYPSLLRHGPTQNQVVAIEDCLIYRLKGDVFLALHEQNLAFRDFFTADESHRLRRAVGKLRAAQQSADPSQLSVYAPVSEAMARRAPVTIGPDANIRDAAKLMAMEDVSTLPVMERGRLIGIMTDKDLRRRVLAMDLPVERAVADIMTPEPLTVGPKQTVLEALMMMSDRGIHHLPVVNDGGDVIAMISANDLLGRVTSNALFIVTEVRRASDMDGVARAIEQMPAAMSGLVDTGVDPGHICQFISSIGETAHRRVLALAEEKLGPAPVPYALICFGSLAREEQGLGSDQDNGFVLSEGYDEAAHGTYFERLGQMLADGLNSAGYVYCPGNIMTSNPDYRLTQAAWFERFRHWMKSPDPQAVLNATIFFDMRALAGEVALVNELRQTVMAEARNNRIFQSFVARGAASARVPLGFFRNFLLHHDEREGDVLDLKKQAIAPVVDIARVLALAGGDEAVSTVERLDNAAAAKLINKDARSDLSDAFAFLRDIRFRHQQEQTRAGQRASNNLDPKSLSRFDREHLRDAFKVIRDQLDSVSRSFAGGIR